MLRTSSCATLRRLPLAYSLIHKVRQIDPNVCVPHVTSAEDVPSAVSHLYFEYRARYPCHHDISESAGVKAIALLASSAAGEPRMGSYAVKMSSRNYVTQTTY